MLVLSRKVGERIWIGEDIAVTVVRITGGGVRIGIDAPSTLPVVRDELRIKLEGESRKPEVDDAKDDTGPTTIKFRSS